MQRMSRGRDQWQLTECTWDFNSLNNVTARGSDQESFQSRKAIFDPCKKWEFSLKTKRWFVFPKSFRQKNNSPFFCKIITRRWWRSFARPRRRWQKPCCPSFTQARKGFLAERRHVAPNNIDAATLESFHMPAPSLEYRALPGRMRKRWDLTLSKAPLRSAWRCWTCQASTIRCGNPPRRPSPFVPACRSNSVCHSSCLFGRRTRTAIHPHAMNSGRFTLCSRWALVRCSNERPGMRAHGDKTSWQRTNILVGGHVALSTSTPPRRAGSDPPRSNWRSFHLPSATAVLEKTTFWSHFVVHDGAGRAKLPYVVEETELLLTSTAADHLLSLRVDLSKRTSSQVDGIQGATIPSGTRALQGWKLRIPLPLKMAPKFSRDRRVRDRTTIGEWHRNNTEWVRHVSYVDAEARRAIDRRVTSWADQRRMHDQTTTHEVSVHTDASWDWARRNASKAPVSFIIFRYKLLFL